MKLCEIVEKIQGTARAPEYVLRQLICFFPVMNIWQIVWRMVSEIQPEKMVHVIHVSIDLEDG